MSLTTHLFGAGTPTSTDDRKQRQEDARRRNERRWKQEDTDEE